MAVNDYFVDGRRWGSKYYACRQCDREISFAQVEYMSSIRPDHTFTVMYMCACNSTALDDIFAVEPDGLRRFLRGMRPVLPYRAAPGVSVPLSPEQEKLLRVFGWECYMLESVEELLLLADRNKPSFWAKPPSS